MCLIKLRMLIHIANSDWRKKKHTEDFKKLGSKSEFISLKPFGNSGRDMVGKKTKLVGQGLICRYHLGTCLVLPRKPQSRWAPLGSFSGMLHQLRCGRSVSFESIWLHTLLSELEVLKCVGLRSCSEEFYLSRPYNWKNAAWRSSRKNVKVMQSTLRSREA